MHRPRSAGASGDQSGRPIEQYEHPDKQRPNNPSVGLVSGENDPVTAKGTYAFDPHLDPSLEWAGKAEHTSFEIPTVSLHVHERIDPRTIVEAVQRTGDLEALGRKYRYQKIFFEAARDVFDQMRPSWKGTPEALLG